jgi:hypothetical protein
MPSRAPTIGSAGRLSDVSDAYLAQSEGRLDQDGLREACGSFPEG